MMIAQCLSYGGYHPVYIPTEEDDSVKEYLRMRDDHKLALKKVKQQINAFCLRHGYYGISQKVLTDSLRQMMSDGLAYRHDYHEQPPRVEYGLTELGTKMLPIVNSLADFGNYYKSIIEQN